MSEPTEEAMHDYVEEIEASGQAAVRSAAKALANHLRAKRPVSTRYAPRTRFWRDPRREVGEGTLNFWTVVRNRHVFWLLLSYVHLLTMLVYRHKAS